jgi:hypothetical protein
MNTQEAWKIVGGLSRPSKMPGWSYGLPAAECKTGQLLVDVVGSTCEGCYATKGCYVFPVVQAAQYRRLESIVKPEWVDAMALLINSASGLTCSGGMTPETCRTKHTYIKFLKCVSCHLRSVTGYQHEKPGPTST